MTAVFNELFNGSNGTALTNANVSIATTIIGGGTSAAAFDTTVKHEGTASAHFTSTTGTKACEWVDSSVATTRYWSFYIYPHATPAANTVILFIGATSGSRTFQVVLNTSTRTVKIQDNTGLLIASNTSSACPLDEWSRIDCSLVGSTVSLALFPGNAHCDDAVGTAIAGDIKSGSTTPPTNPLRYQALGLNSSSTNDVYIDVFRADDAALPGPVGGVANTATPTDNVGITDTVDLQASAWIWSHTVGAG